MRYFGPEGERRMQSFETLAEELNLSPENLQKEGLRALLEMKIHALSLQLGALYRKYGVESYEELDHLIRDGKVEETKTLDDFQTADHLESKVHRLKKILLDQIGS